MTKYPKYTKHITISELEKEMTKLYGDLKNIYFKLDKLDCSEIIDHLDGEIDEVNLAHCQNLIYDALKEFSCYIDYDKVKTI